MNKEEKEVYEHIMVMVRQLDKTSGGNTGDELFK
jgi:hypothetical protein